MDFCKQLKRIKIIFRATPPPLINSNEELKQTVPPPLINSILTENTEIKSDFLDELDVAQSLKGKKKGKMNKVLANTLAVLACIVVYYVWFALGMILERMVFGWEQGNDGGAIYVVAKFVVLIFLIRLVWVKIKSFSK